jgi:hypothetical protein
VVLAGEVEHDELARDPGIRLVADAVVLDDVGIEQIARQAEDQSVGAPVGDVQMRVVVALDQTVRVTFEVAPVVIRSRSWSR